MVEGRTQPEVVTRHSFLRMALLGWKTPYMKSQSSSSECPIEEDKMYGLLVIFKTLEDILSHFSKYCIGRSYEKSTLIKEI